MASASGRALAMPVGISGANLTFQMPVNHIRMVQCGWTRQIGSHEQEFMAPGTRVRFPRLRGRPPIASPPKEANAMQYSQRDPLSTGSRLSGIAALSLLSVALTASLTGAADQGDPGESSDQAIHELIEKAVTARERAFKAIPRARGEGKVTVPIDKGLLDPVLDVSCGYLAKSYGYVHLLREGYTGLSVRDDGKLKVVQARDAHGSQEAFWIDPSRGFHIVRYRDTAETTKGKPLILMDVTRDWVQSDTRWYVRRCTIRHVRREGDKVSATHETELALDTFEPVDTVPSEVFSVYSLGLVDGARIREDWGRGRWRYTTHRMFGKRKVEKIVGELPVPMPRR